MKYSEFDRIIKEQAGDIRLEPLSSEIVDVLKGFEYSPPSNGFLPVDAVGFREVIDSQLSFVVLNGGGGISFKTEPFMQLVDSRGAVVGHDIPLSEKHLYDSPDYIWISDDLFFDVKKVQGYEMKCEIHAMKLDTDFLPDDVSARVHFPCTSSVEFLIDRFGLDENKTSVMLMGVDGVEPDE